MSAEVVQKSMHDLGAHHHVIASILSRLRLASLAQKRLAPGGLKISGNDLCSIKAFPWIYGLFLVL